MASLSTCHQELVVRDGNLVKSCLVKSSAWSRNIESVHNSYALACVNVMFSNAELNNLMSTIP